MKPVETSCIYYFKLLCIVLGSSKIHVRVLIMNKNPSKRGNVSAKQWPLEHKRGKIMDGEETSNDGKSSGWAKCSLWKKKTETKEFLTKNVQHQCVQSKHTCSLNILEKAVNPNWFEFLYGCRHIQGSFDDFLLGLNRKSDTHGHGQNRGGKK